jgi:cation-transporting P-type ATPase I
VAKIAAGSFAVLAGAVQTPGVSHFFGCTPLDPLSWLAVLGCAAAATAGAGLMPPLLGSAPRC